MTFNLVYSIMKLKEIQNNRNKKLKQNVNREIIINKSGCIYICTPIHKYNEFYVFELS